MAGSVGGAVGGESHGGVSVGEVKAEINITPLVDVCLVLLIIFMVVTPMLQKGRPVQLPVTSNPDKKPDEDGQLLISIDHNGGIFLEQNQIPKDLFISMMSEEFQRSASKQVVIKGDKRLTFGDVKDVMVMLNKAGFESVGLITERPQGAMTGLM
jgi:biopolymer transport protein ExbD